MWVLEGLPFTVGGATRLAIEHSILVQTEGNTSMAVRKVLMTGASGYVASQLLPTFQQRYDTLLIDASTLYSRGRSSWPDLEQNRQGEHVEGVATADLNDPDRSSYARYFEGVDAVVHLAFKRDSGEPLDHFFDAKFNVEMNYNVFRCAYDAGVRRVVMASSNAAASWNDRPPMRGRRTEMQDPYKLPLSDNFYGWAKATTEHMGFLFACGGLGRRMEVVMVRVGVPRDPDPSVYASDPAEYSFRLGGHVSPHDLTQLFVKAVETPSIENEDGVPWQVVYAVSNNRRAFWSVASARQALDYQPQDDSEVKFADDIRRLGFEDATGILDVAD